MKNIFPEIPINVGDIFIINHDQFSDNVSIYGSRKIPDHIVPIRQVGFGRVSESGFYKVTSILNSRFHDKFFKEEEEFDVGLEKVAPIDWHDGVDPERFFISLMKMGFTVVSRDIQCLRYDEDFNRIQKMERAWLAVSPERGCIVSTIEYEGKFNSCKFTFVSVAGETSRKILRISDPSSYSLSDYMTVVNVGPNILDVLKDIKISDEKPSKYDKFIFTFPFSQYLLKDKEGNEVRTDRAWENYYRKNRKYFLSLPEKIRNFLFEYTDVGKYFSKKQEANKMY